MKGSMKMVRYLNNGGNSNIEAIKTRISAFHKDTMPWLKWVEEQGWLVHIHADRSVEEIFNDVVKYI